VCVTSQLLDRLEAIIAQNSSVVNEFFGEAFFVTDQFLETNALDWTLGEEKEEHWVCVPTSFLTLDYLQSVVKGDEDQANEAEGEQGPEDNNFAKIFGGIEEDDGGPAKYDPLLVEDITQDREDTDNQKQVKAKLLDFNWIFNGNNAEKFIKVLADSENDDIFATDSIRVLIRFLWDGYFKSITETLFYPFLAYFIAFVSYVTVFSAEHDNEFNFTFVLEMACLVVTGKLYVHFVLLELIQGWRDGISYLFDFWNLMDVASLTLNATYIVCELNQYLDENTINLIGSIAVGIMWLKMFYWMRIFMPFAAFIRTVQEIITRIAVFTIMLMMVLFGFANCVVVLQLNRDEETDPVFDAFTEVPLFDSFIHAYLTGLGDFNKDAYSEHNSKTVWVFFLIATVIVQLVFMNLLIALMSDAYADIMAIQEQSTMKELCSMMEDNIWLLDIGRIFQNQRYILWLTPDKASAQGSQIERQIAQL
jgi:hypothetical protein